MHSMLLNLGYMQENMRLVFHLRDWTDHAVKKAKFPVCTWHSERAAEAATPKFNDQKIVGYSRNQAGLGL